MKTFELNLYDEQYFVRVDVEMYGNALPAIRLVDTKDGSPFATLSVNLPDSPFRIAQARELCDPDTVTIGFIAKLYSENAGLVDLLKYPEFKQIEEFDINMHGSKCAIWTYTP